MEFYGIRWKIMEILSFVKEISRKNLIINKNRYHRDINGVQSQFYKKFYD